MDPHAEVVLIAMPFGPLQAPSIALGLLKSGLEVRGISTRVLYFNLAFAKEIGAALYDEISDKVPSRVDLVGEWIFNGNLFESGQLDIGGYIRDVLRGESRHHRFKRDPATPLSEDWISRILEVRRRTKGFLENCLAEVTRYRPRVVGFTSMFQEHIASLSLAKLIKAQSPNTAVVLGGSNCEGPMGVETARQFRFVDAVVGGEGDLVFPDLVRRFLDHESISDLPGVYTSANIGGIEMVNGKTPVAAPVHDMDALPFPDYDDYFDQCEALGLNLDIFGGPHLMFETARGCWWGQRSHCTFCGLNGLTMAFRSKTPARALEELIHLTNRHPGCPIQVSDNILDLNYLKTFIPELASRKLAVSLFYEVKSNLKKSQVRLLRDAGVDRIQPGIESFSSEILKLMRKGVTGIQNVQLLKWCKELGVAPAFGILCGFPGEPTAEYLRMADLIPLLTHLEPPSGILTTIRLDRFSPNHDFADSFGFKDVAPFPAYGYVYPLADEALANLAYFFSYGHKESRDVPGYTQPLREAVNSWRKEHQDCALFYVDKGEVLLIWDLRTNASEPLQRVTGLIRAVYLACDEASSVKHVQEAVREMTGWDVPAAELQECLELFLERGLMIREGNLYLGLAVALGEYVPSARVMLRFLELVERLGSEVDGTVVIPGERGVRLLAEGVQSREAPADR